MANVLGVLFQSIAVAIREKTGDADKLSPYDFASAIQSITVGSGSTGGSTGGSSGGSSGVSSGLKIAAGEFNPRDTDYKRVSISHGLGVKPDLIFVYADGFASRDFDGDGDTDDADIAAEYKTYPLFFAWGIKASFASSFISDYAPLRGGTSPVFSFTSTTTGLEGTASDSPLISLDGNDKFNVGSTNNTRNFMSGGRYRWIAIAGLGSSGGADVDVAYVTFMSHDGLTELHKRAVVSGNDCMCPVTGVRPELDTPTRESTASQVFTFAGWSTVANGGLDENALKSVTADRTVYANYIEGVRHYTVSFYDGETLLTTQSVAYGSKPTEYTPEKEGYMFDGWSPAFSAVTSDVAYYAKWIDMNSYLGFGDCGDNATWTLSPEGLLTVSGTGAMSNYGFGSSKQPWKDVASYITDVVIEEGITTVGESAFYNCKELKSVTLPNSVTSINLYAFYNTKITTINLPSELTTIGSGSLANCLQLGSIVIPSSVTTIDSGAFNGCSSLTSATFKVTSGWKAGDTTLTSSNLANTKTAATYLRETYVLKKWTRS